jgi:serine/threonine protein kinase
MVDGHTWAELSEGDEFAGYRIERRLGRGGMGILYLGLEPGLERRVALKLIAPEAAADDVFARRFAEESRIAASIEHPNVVPIYAAGEQDGTPFIAMRFVSGSDLGQRISRAGRLDPERAVALIAQIGNGLDAIHAAGLVHRDVKPANVLLSGEEGAEHAYITDFGVARNVATQSGLTQTGRFVGTLDYVAPEQISGGHVDARVDVYALGCLLYKLLTGEVPFPREGEAARLYAHLNDPPPAPSLHAPDVPMTLDDVVIRAMSKQPDDRYPSAGDLGRAAVAALSGAEVTIPERTVATGAATVEAPIVKPAAEEETVESSPRDQGTVSETRPSGLQPPTEATRKLEAGGEGPSDAMRRRRFLFGGGAAALVAAVVLIVILASGGSGGGDTGTTAANTNTTPTNQETTQKQEPKKEEPPRLTQQQFVGKADSICETSKANYLASIHEFPGWKSEADVTFAEQLVDNSSNTQRKLRKLRPPAHQQAAFNRYLTAQNAIVGNDTEALRAAEKEDFEAYEAAFVKREAGGDEREAIAKELGFQACSIRG